MHYIVQVNAKKSTKYCEQHSKIAQYRYEKAFLSEFYIALQFHSNWNFHMHQWHILCIVSKQMGSPQQY
jgi:hypothetical protein